MDDMTKEDKARRVALAWRDIGHQCERLCSQLVQVTGDGRRFGVLHDERAAVQAILSGSNDPAGLAGQQNGAERQVGEAVGYPALFVAEEVKVRADFGGAKDARGGPG